MSALAPLSTASFVAPLVRPFRAEDYVALHSARIQAGGKRLTADVHGQARAYEQAGMSYTAVECGAWNIVASAGLVPIWPGRVLAWALIHPDALSQRRFRRWLRAAVAGRLLELVADHGVRRIEAETMADDTPAINWLMGFGFQAVEKAEECGPDGETMFKFKLLARDL